MVDLHARIGEELGVSDWVELTQEMFDAFAEVTGDRDWLHNDPERAAEAGAFGGRTIAQGHLLLSHFVRFGEEVLPRPDNMDFALNYGYDRVRITRPVSVGTRIRGRLTLKNVRAKNQKQYIMKCAAQIETDDAPGPAVVADWLFFVQLS
jgi:acyl dehydratase